MNHQTDYPTEDQFVAMTPDEFEVFWRTYDAMMCHDMPVGSPVPRRVPNDNELPGLYPDDLKMMFALKRAGWIPNFTHRNNSRGTYPAWPFLWKWIAPDDRRLALRDAYREITAL